jgi:hypothetical protein
MTKSFRSDDTPENEALVLPGPVQMVSSMNLLS